jgi:exopolysaccharide biosynthesis polyprenyl glycosylphosphotransferase
VASPAIFEKSIPRRAPAPVPPAMRVPFPDEVSSRKKVGSLNLGRQSWKTEDREAQRVPENISRVLTESLLPHALFDHKRMKFTATALADFLTVFTTFFLIVNAGSISRNSAQLNAAFLGQLARGQVNTLGWLALYSVLITLFFQAEQLEGRKPNRAQLNTITLGKVILWVTVLLSAAVYQSGTHLSAILWLAAPLNLVGMFGWRTFIRWRRDHAHVRGRGVRRVLIIGAGALGREVAAALESDDGRTLVGFLDDNESLGGSVLGNVGSLPRIARCEFVDEIIVAFPGKTELKRRLILEARRQHLAVSIVPDYFDCESRTLEFECLRGLPLLTLHEDQRKLALYSKRVVDVVLSSLGLLMTAPLIALIALAIKLDSRGPVFYRARRAGRKGQSFACCKFRTMVVNADAWKEQLRKNNEREGPIFKIAADPRVTRVGRFLRRYSLDELPQLCNVLRGEMSLVGPRPHTLDDFQRYQLNHLRRLDVTPGITGLWQVTARQDPSFQRNMALDVEYIENWDFWMDLRILCRTVPAVLSGSGT